MFKKQTINYKKKIIKFLLLEIKKLCKKIYIKLYTAQPLKDNFLLKNRIIFKKK